MREQEGLMNFGGALARIALMAMAWISGVAAAHAEYPDHPIRMIYPFTAGGSGDALARLFANALGNVLGQQVFVDNRPGAGGNIGFAAAARAAPDGYTLLSVSPSFAINVTLYPAPGFDPLKEFVPIAPLSTVPNILIVNSASPYKSLKDLVDDARARPGKLKFGSSGIGTSIHLAAELFKAQAKIDIRHVPYRGAANAGTDLLGGHIDMMFDSAPTALGNVRTGRARALVIAAPRRLSELPDVQTTAEAGYPELLSGAWTGIVAPAGTPQAVIDKLSAAVNRVLHDPTVLEPLSKLGGEPFAGTPAEFGSFIRTEVDRDGVVIRANNIKIE
jgi:tripartite-type tricarboxylate transporter receptor subunit TctC